MQYPLKNLGAVKHVLLKPRYIAAVSEWHMSFPSPNQIASLLSDLMMPYNAVFILPGFARG
jgi:hypothetical protein